MFFPQLPYFLGDNDSDDDDDDDDDGDDDCRKLDNSIGFLMFILSRAANL